MTDTGWFERLGDAETEIIEAVRAGDGIAGLKAFSAYRVLAAEQMRLRAEALETALQTMDFWAHPYLTSGDDRCLNCGEIGAYGHMEPQIITDLLRESRESRAAPETGPPLSERESADGPHMPRPSDVCSVCGNGLVHIDAKRDRAPSLEGARHRFDCECPCHLRMSPPCRECIEGARHPEAGETDRETIARTLHGLIDNCDHSRQLMEPWQCRKWADAILAATRRDHETCIPHGHVEPDRERWERDQAAALAVSPGARHDVPTSPTGTEEAS